MKSVFRKVRHLGRPRSDAEPRESTFAMVMVTVNALAQCGLLVLAGYGYFYTVKPLYSKALLEEQVAEKEIELRKLNSHINETKHRLDEMSLELKQATEATILERSEREKIRRQLDSEKHASSMAKVERDSANAIVGIYETRDRAAWMHSISSTVLACASLRLIASISAYGYLRKSEADLIEIDRLQRCFQEAEKSARSGVMLRKDQDRFLRAIALMSGEVLEVAKSINSSADPVRQDAVRERTALEDRARDLEAKGTEAARREATLARLGDFEISARGNKKVQAIITERLPSDEQLRSRWEALLR